MSRSTFPSLSAIGDHFAEQSKRLREVADDGRKRHGSTKASRAFLRARANAFMDVAILLWNSNIEEPH